MTKRKTVHTEHCTWDSCKYGEESTCEVYLGYATPLIQTYDGWYIGEKPVPITKPTEQEFQERRNWAREYGP